MRGSRGPRGRRIRFLTAVATTFAVITVLPLGLARMAGNDVQPSRAGESAATINLPTRLLGDDSGGPESLSASLWTDDEPVAGMPVDFRLRGPSGPIVCADVITDASGSATCEAGTGPTDAGSWSVVFDGQGPLAAASDTVAVDAPSEDAEPAGPTTPPVPLEPGSDEPTAEPDPDGDGDDTTGPERPDSLLSAATPGASTIGGDTPVEAP